MIGDVQFLNFSPGASSSSLDIFQKLQESKLGLTSPHEAIINPGDILFIPPLWLHAVAPTEGVSIAVNIVSSPSNPYLRYLPSSAAGKTGDSVH